MNNVRASLARDGPRDRRARRQGHPDLHQRQRPAARRSGVLPDLRAHGEQVRPADLGAPDAHREVRRLPDARPKSKYEICWLFGWPYETSVFMARLVFSGMFEKLPEPRRSSPTTSARWRRSSTHRIGYGMDQLGARTSDEDYDGDPASAWRSARSTTSRCSTTTPRSTAGRAAIRCGLDFFGSRPRPVRHRLPVRSARAARSSSAKTIKAIDSLKLKPEDDRRRSTSATRMSMLRLKLPK